MTTDAIVSIDRLQRELVALRPLPPDVVARVAQKLRIESNYHSNAIEGNTLTLSETRGLILHGLTARGKPMRDHLDIQGHDDAVKAIQEAVTSEHGLNEVFIRNLHRVLLKEPYEAEATNPNGRPTRRRITIGEYKAVPNNVRTLTGEVYYFTPPEQVKSAMTDLIDWYREREAEKEHPVIVAATLHYRFVRIHPFDDGNGRMARLLMNLALMKHGYTVAIIERRKRDQYIRELERVDHTEDLTQFIDFIAYACEDSLKLHLRAARGESIEDSDDIDREIGLFKRSLGEKAKPGEPIALRSYMEEVVCPLYGYCQSKMRLLSDAFTVTAAHLNVQCTDVNNDPFHWNFGLEVSVANLPEKVRLASFWILFALQREEEKQVFINVRNELSSESCVWTFGLGDGSGDRYAGRDLEFLKKNFNQLLRALMAQT